MAEATVEFDATGAHPGTVATAEAVAPEPAGAGRGRLASLVVSSLVALIAAGTWGGRLDEATKVPFARQPIDDLIAARPEYVFIGNSMLETRIDEEHLESLVGAEVALFDTGGSASAQWYLHLKNHVAASGVRPRRVVIFFRDEYLTEPRFRTTGEYRRTLEAVAHDDEPAFERLVGLSADEEFGRAHRAVRAMVPVHRLRPGLEDGIDRFGLWAAERTIDNTSRLEERINELFAVDRLRAVAQDDIAVGESPPAVGSFEHALERSFLPEIIAVAAQHDLPLFFVRVQRRPRDDGSLPSSGKLDEYMGALASYLRAHGAGFRDLTGHPRITLELYGKGDHIAEEQRRLYTGLFVEAVPEIFE